MCWIDVYRFKFFGSWSLFNWLYMYIFLVKVFVFFFLFGLFLEVMVYFMEYDNGNEVECCVRNFGLNLEYFNIIFVDF